MKQNKPIIGTRDVHESKLKFLTKNTNFKDRTANLILGQKSERTDATRRLKRKQAAKQPFCEYALKVILNSKLEIKYHKVID